MKVKVLALLFVMTLIFPLVSVEKSRAAGDTYIITPDIGVNLRAEPKQDSTIVAKLKQGYRVETLKDSGEWVKVSYDGKEGYVKSEYLKQLDIDLVGAYKYYANVLENMVMDIHFSLLFDFTQDGLEELYIMYPSDNGEVRHKMLSGQTELFDEAVWDEGLTVYWDDYNYYLVQTDTGFSKVGDRYTPEALGINSRHEFVSLNISREIFSLIQPGNLSLSKTEIKNSHRYIYNFETNGQYFEDEDDIEIHEYLIGEKEVTKEQWEKALSVYQNAPNQLELPGYYGDENFDETSNFFETVDKLYALYEEYSDSPTEPLLEETAIEAIESYTNYMLQSDSLKIENQNEIDYYALLNMALYYAMGLGELDDDEEGTYKYPKVTVDEWMYSNFGVKMDNQKLQDHTLRHETEHGAEYTKLIEIQDEYYMAPGSGDLGIGNEPHIINQYQLENDFIALEYVHGYIKALSIMNEESKYIIVKKVETANGKTYYPYIDTVQTLENLDYNALNNYAEMLSVVKDHKQVETVDGAVGKEIEGVHAKKASRGQVKITNFIRYALVAIGGLFLLAAVVVVNSKKIKKPAIIMLIIFFVIVVGTAVSIDINSSQSQIKSDASSGDDEQNPNDDKVDVSNPKTTDVSNEIAVPSITEDADSTIDENKIAYMESIQYSENLLSDAIIFSDSIDGLWDAYHAWDDELNRIYGLLKEKLSPQKMEELRIEQREWIKERDSKANPDVVDTFTEIEILNNLVRERTLYLIDMYFDEE